MTGDEVAKIREIEHRLMDIVQEMSVLCGDEQAVAPASAATNTGSPKLPPCGTCEHPMFEHQWLYKSYNYCPECGRQLRAGA